MSVCDLCDREMEKTDSCVSNKNEYMGGIILKPLPYDGEDCLKCPDCGLSTGGFQHFLCDIERCLRCGGQLISCNYGDKSTDTKTFFTIKEIFEIEPELLCMDREIRSIPLKGEDNPHDRWHGPSRLKGRMNRFVGWAASKKEIRTVHAHTICYERFYDLLHKRCLNPNVDLTFFKTKHFKPLELLDQMTN